MYIKVFKINVFCYLTSCDLLETLHRLGGISYINLQCSYQTTRYHT